jgi:hypothetical protein
MRKYLTIVGIFIGVLIFFGGLFWFIKGKKPPSEIGLPTPAQTSVALEERPYVSLIPRADGHELKLKVENLNYVQSVEYELVYFVGDVSRGVIGSVDLKGENSFSRDLLLGSCSRNVCKYDEGVSEGILTLRFKAVNLGTQKYELPFRLQTGKEGKKEGLTSKDGNFIFQGDLNPSSFYLIHSTLGLPLPYKGKIIGGPYGIFTSGSTNVKGVIKLRLMEKSSEVKILGWDGNSWKEYSKGFETDGEVVSVEVDRLTCFIAVSPKSD